MFLIETVKGKSLLRRVVKVFRVLHNGEHFPLYCTDITSV